MKKSIMVQGTASSAGKSLLTAALCRIFVQDGYRVAPFKSQNMALNSFITEEGLEMGRAQVVQSEACRIKPRAAMNPILLKPTSDSGSQVIIEGRVYKNMAARDYYKFKPELREVIMRNYRKLEEEHEIIVLEGAGSPAEINLKDDDIVNMGMAEMADAPVILVGDIDRGGVFASLVGTLMLLTEEERARVKGVVINKFRGDVEILRPGLVQLEELTGVPVLGVVPYLPQLKIEDEDSLAEKLNVREGGGRELDVAVIRLPYISNFTDFDVFELFSDVGLRYVERPEELGSPDLLILPGSKSTISDLLFLKESGLAELILSYYERGGRLAGICGGYQMLGRFVRDPHAVESELTGAEGLALIDMETVMLKEKVTTQVRGQVSRALPFKELAGAEIKGYEIHMGESRYRGERENFVSLAGRDGLSGFCSERVLGSYIHGLFDNVHFTRGLLNRVRAGKGLAPLRVEQSYSDFKEHEYNRLAKSVRESLDMERIYRILEKKC